VHHVVATVDGERYVLTVANRQLKVAIVMAKWRRRHPNAIKCADELDELCLARGSLRLPVP
jgi:hypothetical protein